MSSDFIKHVKGFEEDDNNRGFKKHTFKKKSRYDKNFELDDNFIQGKSKHILNFESDDNFRGRV